MSTLSLGSQEKARVLQLLISEVSYHAGRGEMTIEFRPGGVRTLASNSEEEPQ